MQSTVDSLVAAGLDRPDGRCQPGGAGRAEARDERGASGRAAADQQGDDQSVAAISAEINGERRSFSVEGGTTLLTALRETLGLTAAKEGCAQGDCGSCIVVMDGEPVNSCLVLAAEAQGKAITTLEGLARNGELHPLQREFTELWAFQCGYCTPGMVMSCFALLSVNPDPTEAQIREAIEGNLCRCTNYRPIVDAVRAAAVELRGKQAEAQRARGAE